MTVCCTAAANPDPVSATESEDGLLVANVSVPDTLPATVGANNTCMVTLLPAFTVSGNDVVASAKPAPLSVAEFTVPAAVPEFEMVIVCASDDPTFT